jgi:DNA-binding response OmpR family regulator
VRVLLVEDHASIAEAITVILERKNYAVLRVADGATAIRLLREDTFDLAIVDVGLPDVDGFTVCKSARETHLDLPILILSARESVEDRIQGLDAGADDYLIKPFHEEELFARLRTLTRRAHRPIQERIVMGNVTFEPESRRVTGKHGIIPLAATEFRVFELLACNAGITLTRGQILDRIWGPEFEGDENIVDVYVSAIRRKFKADGSPLRITTVRGLGYRCDG